MPRTGEKDPSRLARRQKVSSALRAPSIPPPSQPSTITTTFMAPALAPVVASTARRPSSRRASSTPHVNAPWAPPPCRASDTVFWARPARPPVSPGWGRTRPVIAPPRWNSVMNHALVTGATAFLHSSRKCHIPPGERSAILPARWNARHAKRPSQISRRTSIGYTGTCVRCRPSRHSDLYGYQGTVNGIAAHSVSSLDSAMGSAVHTTFRAPAGDSSAQPRGRLVTGGGTDATLKWLHHNAFRIRSLFRHCLRPLKSAPRPSA